MSKGVRFLCGTHIYVKLGSVTELCLTCRNYSFIIFSRVNFPTGEFIMLSNNKTNSTSPVPLNNDMVQYTLRKFVITLLLQNFYDI